MNDLFGNMGIRLIPGTKFSDGASDGKHYWLTPPDVYTRLDREFGFDFDPCPTNPTFNGLSIDWKHTNFCNPPYGREIPKWIKKGYEEWKKGKVVVFLIPSRTDTTWWHDYVMKATEIRFIKGRLKFDNYKNPAPFPSMRQDRRYCYRKALSRSGFLRWPNRRPRNSDHSKTMRSDADSRHTSMMSAD